MPETSESIAVDSGVPLTPPATDITPATGLLLDISTILSAIFTSTTSNPAYTELIKIISARHSGAPAAVTAAVVNENSINVTIGGKTFNLSVNDCINFMNDGETRTAKITGVDINKIVVKVASKRDTNRWSRNEEPIKFNEASSCICESITKIDECP